MTKSRKGQAPPPLSREAFRQRFDNFFLDPAFAADRDAIARVEAIAWDGYINGRKSPVTQKAGPEFAHPDFDMSVEWLETRDRLLAAEAKQKHLATRSRVLVICGAARNDGTCPGEISKTFRLAGVAHETLEAPILRSTGST